MDVNDPLAMGRIKANVPDVFGSNSSGWAMPCVPFAGMGSGFFVVPPADSGVWIEFEHGDLEFPIWTGGWWGSALELPSEAQVPAAPGMQKIVIKTTGGHSLVIDDTPAIGGFTLKLSTGAKITITDIAITIDNGMGGKIEMTGPQISVNSGALEVI